MRSPRVAHHWPALGFAVTSAAGIGLSVATARRGAILDARWTILAGLAVWSAAWALGVVCALRLPRHVALVAVFAVATALRLAAISGPPTLSDDMYRYAWDGRVQASGTDPYRYAPDAPELAGLREPWLWPDDAGCAALDRPPGCTRINRPSARTIYPPLAQAWFTGVYRVAGLSTQHKAWQVVGLLTDLALVALLPVALRAWKRDPRWTALYALAPFAVVEAVNNAHVDGLAALIVVLALIAAGRRRVVLAAGLLGGAALVKLYPAILVLSLAGAEGRRRAAVLPLVGTAVAVAAAGYLPHVAFVGPKVLGYLPGYLREERYTGGGRYLLAGLLGLPGSVTAALAVLGVGAVVAWVVWRRPDPPRGAAAIFGAVLLATTPVQPWYAVTLLALAAAAALPAWAVVAAAGYPYFFAVILDAAHPVGIGRVCYGVALASVLGGAWWRRRSDVRAPSVANI
ncbi:MAG: glycosyltransferase 87 family protein [Acidimicrobiales bacterium]